MKTKKRIWAILLSMAMIITMLPAMAFAEEAAEEPAEATEITEEAVETEAPAEEPAANDDAAAEPLRAPASGQEDASLTRDGETAAAPVSVEWQAEYALKGAIATNKIYNLYTPDMGSFTVTYGSGTESTTREFVCRRTGTEDDIDYGFYDTGIDDWDDELAQISIFVDEEYGKFAEGTNENVPLIVTVPYEDQGEVKYATLTTTVEVLCYYERLPVSVEFVPADGFTPKCYIGNNFLTVANFYGAGNKFTVTYKSYDFENDEYTEYASSFYYRKDVIDGVEEEGFFWRDRPGDTRFEFVEGKEAVLSKGSNEVGFEYEEFVDELDKTVKVKFTININVKEHNAYASYPVYAYTGKVIKPKFKVFDSEDQLIPASEYTVSKATAKAMGWHQVTITFKDKSKYEDTITAYYAIGPNKPKLTGVTAGKKKLTVKWKKLTKAQLKRVDGMVIEVSTDKSFANIVKTVNLTKKQVKSGKKVVKGLKKGKRYYVRIHTFKNVKQNGEKAAVPSPDSVVKSKKTK